MNIRQVFLWLFVLVVPGGCADTQQAKKVQTSGFLGDYSMLRKGGEGEALLVYRNPTADFSKYKMVHVDPVRIWQVKDSGNSDVSKEDLQRLADDFRAKVVWHLNQDYLVAPHPGPGVMRIQMALTEAEPSNVGMDVVETVLPPMQIFSGAQSMATGTRAFVGSASVEGKLTDGQTGELLFAAVDRRVGGKTLDGSMDSWDDVEQSFDYWADLIRKRLRRLREGS